MPRLEFGDARPQHDQHADEADDNSAPAAPADLLAEDRHRQRGHHHRHGEDQRIGVGQRQLDEGVEHQHHVDRQQDRAQAHQPGMARPQLVQAALMPDQQRHGDQREQVGDENNLENRVTLGQPFDPRIGAGENRKRNQRENDPARDMIAGCPMGG